MNPTIVAAASVAGALILMLGALAWAVPRTVQPIQRVTVIRINGHKVTQEVGIVKSWSLSGGHMTLEYVTDTVFSADFDAPR
jgi:hypothetical protein